MGGLDEQLNTPARLESSDPKILIGRVQYVDYQVEGIPSGNIFFPSMFKRQAFSHEREARAMLMDIEWAIHDGGVDFSRDAPPGFTVEVDLGALIDEVRIAPTVATWVAELVAETTGKYGLKVPVSQSDLGSAPSW